MSRARVVARRVPRRMSEQGAEGEGMTGQGGKISLQRGLDVDKTLWQD